MLKPFLVIMTLPIVSSCYTLKQAYHFNNLFNSRVKVSDVLQDKNQPSEILEKLQLVQNIIKFAKAQGLNTEGAYQYYIHSDGGSVSHLVQAADRTQLKFKTWWFPFVGSVPYLGFFDAKERDQLYQELAKDYDVSKSSVGAFSSLGWFEDPIYTSMLKRRFTDIAHLFFHELVHRTYWSVGTTRFNENLAEFCAEILTESYLKTLGQRDAITEYFARRRDKVKYVDWLRNLRNDLRDLYARNDINHQETLDLKWAMIESYQDAVPKFESTRYDFIKRKKWNNASILGASLYTPDTSRFYRAFQCLGRPKISIFLDRLRTLRETYEDNFQALDSLCKDA